MNSEFIRNTEGLQSGQRPIYSFNNEEMQSSSKLRPKYSQNSIKTERSRNLYRTEDSRSWV
jgi:hypothetical protein